MNPLDLAEIEERVYSDLARLAKSGRDLLSCEMIHNTRTSVEGVSDKKPTHNRVSKMVRKGWEVVGTVKGTKMTLDGVTIIIDEGGRVFEKGVKSAQV